MAFWLAMTVLFVSLLFGWETAASVAGSAFLALLVPVTVIVGLRMARGSSWDEAWGGADRE